mmetsp:Transcript_17873/g.49512  ORF Transcript_17873/g.49512 Transcript_17873/m.49512 type:complete len:143 (+) Transcript_17873:155-583(+)
MAFPCNQFGGHESKSEQAIKSMAVARYGAKFSLFSKIDVNGSNMSPVYSFLKSRFPGEIKWNFASKFLVDRTGQVVMRIDGSTAEAAAAVKRLLRQGHHGGQSALAVWQWRRHCMRIDSPRWMDFGRQEAKPDAMAVTTYRH